MTIDDQLLELRLAIDKEAEAVRLRAQQQIDQLYAAYHDNFDALLAQYNKQRCPNCDGFGKLERLDASYMRRFGLRDWDGCEICGGHKAGTPVGSEAVQGNGYIDKV